MYFELCGNTILEYVPETFRMLGVTRGRVMMVAWSPYRMMT